MELWSVNFQTAQKDRLSQIESQIELLAVTVKEGMAAAKALSRKGAASRESSQKINSMHRQQLTFYATNLIIGMAFCRFASAISPLLLGRPSHGLFTLTKMSLPTMLVSRVMQSLVPNYWELLT